MEILAEKKVRVTMCLKVKVKRTLNRPSGTLVWNKIMVEQEGVKSYRNQILETLRSLKIRLELGVKYLTEE